MAALFHGIVTGSTNAQESTESFNGLMRSQPINQPYRLISSDTKSAVEDSTGQRNSYSNTLIRRSQINEATKEGILA